MGKNKIEKRDIVEVNFSTHPPIRGIVDYVPVATGDCWVIIENDIPVYVQQFDFIRLIKKDWFNQEE